jgi:N-acetylneuraminate lyase
MTANRNVMELNKFKGIFVAMNACYDERGDISPAAAKKLTRFLAEKGVNGVYVGGSTGEGFLQSVEERKRILEAVKEEAPAGFTVIAQVGAISTRDSIELAVHADSVGVDAISAVPPFYYKVSESGAERHWRSIMEATGIPFIIYHIPSATGFSLTTGLLRKMLQYEQVIGVKITTPSSYELQQFKAIGGERFVVFNGPDEQYLAGRIMGADGGIGGTYGVMPELFVHIERCYNEGNIAEARRWQFTVNDIISDLLGLPIYGAIKEVLKMRGIDTGAPRPPIEPLDPADRGKAEQIWRKIERAIDQLPTTGK